MNIATWNMQGINSGVGGSKLPGITNLIRQNDVVCLQEAGLPYFAQPIRQAQPIRWGTPAPNLATDIFYYNFGTVTNPSRAWCFWGYSDLGANRVNVAICSRHRPDLYLFVPAQVINNQGVHPRPAVGMFFNGFGSVYSLHALANGGTDVGHILQSINAFTPANLYPWYALGDYNRSPNTVVGMGTVCPPNQPTQISGGFLDWMTTSVNNAITGTVGDNYFSDHFSVSYVVP